MVLLTLAATIYHMLLVFHFSGTGCDANRLYHPR